MATRPEPAAPVALDEVRLPERSAWWRRVGKHPRAMHYNRLIALVFLANALVLWRHLPDAPTPRTLSLIALVNFTVGIVIRQQHVVNLLFRLATAAPATWPLPVRWTLAKVYHFGGLHVGATVAGTLWYLAYVVTAARSASAPLLAITWGTCLFLVGIIVTALPPVRARFHDLFERTHRFAGWTVLAAFWAQTLVLATAEADGTGLGARLAGDPAVWLMLVITLSVAHPWTRLRRVPVDVERPSSHVAVVRFGHHTPFPGSSTAVSRSPLSEWHSFANIPAPEEDGFRLAVSRAGDWTGRMIDEPPTHLWVKGITTAGVANVEVLFKRVVYVATGSGIGPCLPHLLAREVPSTLVWSARDPRGTYGDALVDEILDAQPAAIVWDTAVHGKPDMVRLAYQAYRTSGAEAVICISNKKLTWQVVHGLETRGIPACGAIWDS
ncbi:hypothetical protein ABT160_20330 [Streptomyces sp. NPDC001941]|uniref:hypothetical protein n=1 Tax=Streptomyces sp. NPDC001941 TaxID=3154659 RepID=UPI0033298CBF